MQSLDWYSYRLRAMTPGEILWRVHGGLRDVVDGFMVDERARANKSLPAANECGRRIDPGFSVTDLDVGAWCSGSGESGPWASRLRTRAEHLAAGRLSFFDLREQPCGRPIDWNRDHKSGKRAPMDFSARIDYRDVRVTGDAKYVWEPSRHQHLVVLARAYRATGDARFAAAVVEQLESWIEQCPCGRGMQWRSPLELAIRLINWVWALDLIRPSGVITEACQARLLQSVFMHLWEITRKYSRGSSANNHLVGEAAGVFIAASYFKGLKHSGRRRARAKQILCREIRRQTFSDGGNREQAFGYHLFALQFFLFAGLVARRSGDDMPREYWSGVEKMFEFAANMIAGGEALPMYGDADDGFVLDLGENGQDLRGLMAVAAVLFGRRDFKSSSRRCGEAVAWLLGDAGCKEYHALECDRHTPLASRAFEAAGIYLLQHGMAAGDDRISVMFDCGEHGYRSIAAHAHADSLSFTLRAFGVDVLVDPGTFDYFTHPAWRAYFRSTRAHNTIEIDGLDQSVMLGAFMWGPRARARCLAWSPSATGGHVAGEHDGYRRLADPVIHRRELVLDGAARSLSVRDRLAAHGRHDVALYFHFAEHCRVERAGTNRFAIDTGRGTVMMQLDPALRVQTVCGSSDPIGGWVSRGYHHRAPTTTICARCHSNGAALFATDFFIGQPASSDVPRREILAGRPAGVQS